MRKRKQKESKKKKKQLGHQIRDMSDITKDYEHGRTNHGGKIDDVVV